jgi:hypothetical protein
MNKTVDMPQWSPSNAAMRRAWTRSHGILRAHEARHEAIATGWKERLPGRLTGLDLTLSATNRTDAEAEAPTAADGDWQGWINQHQADQSAIDPFTAPFDCPD